MKMSYDIKEAVRLESRLVDLFMGVGCHMADYYKSIQLMRDNDFVRRRDRITNDIHAFLELSQGGYFHLKAYTRHMLDHPDQSQNMVFLTGYRKDEVSHVGGRHSLKQQWYENDIGAIAYQILEQNKDILNPRVK